MHFPYYMLQLSVAWHLNLPSVSSSWRFSISLPTCLNFNLYWEFPLFSINTCSCLFSCLFSISLTLLFYPSLVQCIALHNSFPFLPQTACLFSQESLNSSLSLRIPFKLKDQAAKPKTRETGMSAHGLPVARLQDPNRVPLQYHFSTTLSVSPSNILPHGNFTYSW